MLYAIYIYIKLTTGGRVLQQLEYPIFKHLVKEFTSFLAEIAQKLYKYQIELVKVFARVEFLIPQKFSSISTLIGHCMLWSFYSLAYLKNFVIKPQICKGFF